MDWRGRRLSRPRGHRVSTCPHDTERVLVAVCARARPCQQPRALDARLRPDLRSCVAVVASRRHRSARPPPRSMAGMGPGRAVAPRARPLRADVLMSKGRVLREAWQFLRQEKKYWLL